MAVSRLRFKIKSRRSFTILEVMMVVVLIAVVGGVAAWSLTDLLRQSRARAEIDDFKNLVQELQIEALALGSDMELSLYKADGAWKACSKTSEDILKDRTLELKHIDQITIDGKTLEEKRTLNLLSTGGFQEKVVIALKGAAPAIWIDLRYPVLIKFSKKEPKAISQEMLPEKPVKKDKNGNHQPGF